MIASREARYAEAAAQPAGKPIARWNLPRGLSEISGLALTRDGWLLAHDDNAARITEIDYRRGTIVKTFGVGQPVVKGDFEGIAVRGEDGTVFLLASNGQVLELREGENGATVPYRLLDTKLGGECEFEGVAFEPASNSLVLACKTVFRKGLDNALVLYRWRLSGGSSDERASRMVIPLSRIVDAKNRYWKSLHPSDLTIDPASGHFVLVAAQEHALVEITPNGNPVRAEALPGRHPQVEGVAITADRVLILSDEGRPASVSLYRWP